MELLGTLPLTLNPEENFSTIIDGVNYDIKQLWNTIGFWTLDISDSDGNMLVAGAKIAAGIFMLQQYPQVSFDLIIDGIIDPDRDNLASLIVEVWSK